MKKIASKIGRSESMNDEHIISKHFDITVFKGFATCHLHFSDQRSALSDAEEVKILSKYRNVMEEYLGQSATY